MKAEGGREEIDKATSRAMLNQNGSLAFLASSIPADMWD